MINETLSNFQSEEKLLKNTDLKETKVSGENLNEIFENLRYKLEEVGSRLGFLHPDVLLISQRLDEVHNQMLQ